MTRKKKAPSYSIDEDIFLSGIISKREFEKERSNTKGMSDADIVWRLFNNKLLAALKEGDWGEAKIIYYDMAIFSAKEDREFFHLLQEARRCELNKYKNNGLVDKVEILTAGPGNSCELCLQSAGKKLTIEEALKTMPIPAKDCQKDVFNTGKGFCRCSYIAASYLDYDQWKEKNKK